MKEQQNYFANSSIISFVLTLKNVCSLLSFVLYLLCINRLGFAPVIYSQG